MIEIQVFYNRGGKIKKLPKKVVQAQIGKEIQEIDKVEWNSGVSQKIRQLVYARFHHLHLVKIKCSKQVEMEI
jgi:hypothetical protein